MVAAAALAAAARFWALGEPAGLVFDEVYYVPAARQVLAGHEVTEERTHPPLSKLIIAGSIRLAGDRPVGWRLASAVAGVLTIAVVYALGRALFHDVFVAVAAALLAALDGLLFVESRVAKPDVFLVLFAATAYWAFWRYLHAAGAARGRYAWLLLAGAAAGCAVATKWTAVPPLLGLGVLFVVAHGRQAPAAARADGWALLGALGLLPVGIYLLAYVPYLQRGHTLGDLVALHRWMFAFHTGLTQGHPYQSAWWSWPLLVRPIWYEYREVAPGVARGVLAIGNPVLWWAALPALAATALAAVRARSRADAVLLVGFALGWGQYAFISRVLFLYHFLLALPFLLLALARGLGRGRTAGDGPVLLYLALAAAWFVAFFPLLAGQPIALAHYRRLIWFGSWI